MELVTTVRDFAHEVTMRHLALTRIFALLSMSL